MTRNFLHFDNSPTPSTHVTAHDECGPISFIAGDLDGPWDLTGSVIVFLFQATFDTFAKRDIYPDPDQVNHRGHASGFWKVDELKSLAAGNFPCQVQIIFPTGKVHFAPERPLNTLVISDTLLLSPPVPSPI